MLLAFAPAMAFGASSAALQAELDGIYQQLLVNPSDVAMNRRMIEIAVELKDYDAAIGAVERLIFYDPDNVDLQLEAARYYLEIKSYAAVAGYAKDAVALDGLTAEQQGEAEQLLAAADRGTQPSPWAAFVQTGFRYQTNASQGSALLGLNEPLPFDKPEADWNSFALGTLGLSQPINKNLAIEGTVSGYYADQFKIDRLDLGFAEVVLGPRLMTDNEALSVKPYALAQTILLGEDPYQSAWGGGVLARVVYADGWWIEPQFEYKNRTYYNSENYPTAEDQTGELYTYGVNLNGEFNENFGWSSRIAYHQNFAAASYQSYDQFVATIALQIAFDLLGKENWSLSPFANLTVTDFQGVAPPERYAGLHTIRHDTQWSIGANLEVPIHEQFAFGLAVEYTENNSNLDRDTYDNFKVVFGPQARF